ncbi:hypothetical protein FH972_025459 [Carpinus fangiana]|uniref:ATP-dependent RNA helicase n=1 Tax=Carpinus fangiana TaxID=176857 RepID=A0A5N6L245_9ROSI|nr:hypothetical protein FH972_025459 [Carpinus fangiana]
MYARYIPPPVEPPASTLAPHNSGQTSRETSKKRKRKDKSNDKTSEKRSRHTDSDDSEADKDLSIEVKSHRSKTSKSKDPPRDKHSKDGARINGNSYDEQDAHATALDAASDGSAHDNERERRRTERRAAKRAARKTLVEEVEDLPSKAHSRILQKFEKSAQAPQGKGSEEEKESEEEAELRDLVPIPRPKAAANAFATPTFSALPSWLSKPLVIPPDQTASFPVLGVEKLLLGKLKEEGFKQALPVQAGVLPLLLPTSDQHPGDVCVSAATGSGKTIAYILPIIQSLRQRVQVRLRAILVVPTRELVSQVRRVAESCAKGTDLKIGAAVGSHALKAEQEALVQRTNRYDPAGWADLAKLLHQSVDDMSSWDDPEHDARVQEALTTLPAHMPEYLSKVDILICTPGRLVDHIKSTRGFTLRHLEWMIIDEADRLLDQSFQEWADAVNTALRSTLQTRSGGVKGITSLFEHTVIEPHRRGVRKVMLSATMTKDLGQLDALQLQNPKLVVVGSTMDTDGDDADGVAVRAVTSATTLPATLEEHAVPVKDGSKKPLYLMQLLDIVFDVTTEFSINGGIMATRKKSRSEEDQSNSDDDSDVSSVLSSDSSSDASSRSNDSDSDSEDESNGSSTTSTTSSASESESSTSESSDEASIPTPIPQEPGVKPTTTPKNALIFTSTNEAALRLSSLLTSLSSGHAMPYKVATITKSSSSATTRATLQAFNTGSLNILIASDRIARGLDLPALSTVINYDVPRSTTSYVHRAGRTARAGRIGTAWTLLESREARWFWKEIGSADAAMARAAGKSVQRTRLAGENGWDEGVQAQYARALSRLKRDVLG